MDQPLSGAPRWHRDLARRRRYLSLIAVAVLCTVSWGLIGLLIFALAP